MNAEFLKVCGFALVSLSVILVLRQLNPTMAAMCVLASAIAIFGYAVSIAAPAAAELGSILSGAIEGEYIAVPAKALGIALVSQTVSDVCRDCGESSLAGKVELAGKAALLMLSLPLIKDMLSLGTSVMYG